MIGFKQSSRPVSETNISSSNITNLSNNELQRLTISDKVTDDIIFVTEYFLYPIISVFALTGNVFSIAILLQPKMRTSTSVSLTALAVSNSLFLITNTLWKSTCIIKSSDMVLYYKYYAYGFSVLFYLIISFSRISTWLMVVIASEKMVAVTFPLKVKIYFTIRNISVLVVIISIATFLFLSPFCLTFRVDYIYDRRLQAIRVYMKETEYQRDNKYLLDNYINYFLVIAFRYLPMVLVVVVNTKTGIALRKNRRSRQMTFPNSINLAKYGKEHRITVLLVTIVTVFIICLLPGNIHAAVSMAVEEYNLYRKYHNLYIAMGNISLLLELLNSSIIFFVYMATNNKFIKMFKGIFCKCTAKEWANAEVKLLATQKQREYEHLRLNIQQTTEFPGTTKTMFELEVRSTNHLDQTSNADPTTL